MMEIATYGPDTLHERLALALKERGVDEPIGHYDRLTAEERQHIRIVFGWRMTQAVLDSLPHLQWIQGAGAGVDWLLPVRVPAGVRVTRIVGQFGPDMGEYALMAVLAWVKDWKRLQQQQKEHRWDQYLVGTLTPLTVGVLGAGSIGAHVATMFLPLVAQVRALGRRTPEIEGVRGYSRDAADAFYEGLDVLVMALPHTPDTYHLVGAQEISRMRDGGILVNVGRGAVLDEAAVVGALRSGKLSHAQLDVFETEPLPSDSALWDTENLSISPHISGPSRIAGMAAVFHDNIIRFRQGRPLVGEVDLARGY